MRKLLLITTILVAATSAQAMQTRGLSAPMANTQTAQLQIDEPKQSVADQLKAIGEAPKPVTTEQAPVVASAPAPATQVPATTAPAAAGPVASQTQPTDTKAEARPAKKPVKKAKAQRRETDEQKARRIAARYGISW